MEFDAKTEMKKLSFLAIMTFILVLGFMAASLYALVQGGTGYKDFSASIGPLAGMLLGYWVRDSKNGE